MATVAELLVRIGGDSSGLRREIANSQRQLRRAFGQDALDASEGAAGALAGLAAAMVGVGVASVSMSSKLNQTRSAFEVLLESGDKANKMISDLKTYANNTSFTFDGLSSTAKSMLAVGINGQDVIPIIASVGDAIGTLGGGTEALQGVVRALAQIQAKGKLSAEEMNQLAERGIPGWRYVSEAMGKTTAEVMKMTADGAVDATTAINAIVGGMSTQFKGGAQKANAEITGQFESMKETVTTIMAELGGKITESLNLKNLFSELNKSIGDFSAAIKSSGVKDAILGLVPPEAIAAVFALGGALVGSAALGMYSFALATWAAIAPLVPFIAYGAAVGLLAYEIWKNWSPLGSLFDQLWTHLSISANSYLNGLQTDFYTAISYIMKLLVPLANLFGGSMATAVNAWADNVGSQLQVLGYESGYLKDRMENNFDAMGKSVKGLSLGLKGLDLPGSLRDIKEVDGGVETTFKGLSNPGVGGASSGAAGGGSASKEAEQAYKAMQQAAEQAHNSIRAEWIRTTMTALQQHEVWYEDEKETLKKSMEANANYAEDKAMLEQVYLKKKTEMEAKQAEESEKLRIKERNDIASHAKLREEIDAAYAANSMAQLRALLTEENSIKLNNWTAEQSMMETYEQAKRQAHSTTAQLMADLYNTALGGLETALSDIFTGVKSIGSAFESLGKTMIKVVADYYAKQIAGQLITSMMGKENAKKQLAEDTKTGAATASAWWPAAVARSLATAGGNAGPAILGMAAASAAAAAMGSMLSGIGGKATGGPISGQGTGTSDSILSWLSDGEYVIKASAARMLGLDNLNMLNNGIMPAFATGGIVTGPSLSSVSSRYLNPAMSLDRRLIEGRGGGSSQGNVITQNNYGDIRTDVDYERMNSDFGNLIESAIMGV